MEFTKDEKFDVMLFLATQLAQNLWILFGTIFWKPKIMDWMALNFVFYINL